jgi:hypothetical protein
VTPLDLRALLASLNGHAVEFVLIGGVAVAAHGYVRATEDLDVVPDPSDENLLRLGNGLVDLGATLPMDAGRPFTPAQDAGSLSQGRNLTVHTRFGSLDIVQRLPGVPGYPELERDAVRSDLLGVPVRVCSLEHLRGMKEARRATQDLADLERLPSSG